MNITVIGAGNMGAGFVKQLTQAGHKVTVVSRDAAKAAKLAAEHQGASSSSAADAAASADVVILATGYNDAVAALKSLGSLKGKVVVDITNPLTADYMGLTIGHGTSAAEEIAKAIDGAELVKAFNTVFAQVLTQGPDFGANRKVDVYVASDSENAKSKVSSVAESMGFNVVDAGGLKNARYLEPLAGLNIYFAYGAGHGTDIAPTWIRKS
jgi:NADPH-dependent F420 reductase